MDRDFGKATLLLFVIVPCSFSSRLLASVHWLCVEWDGVGFGFGVFLGIVETFGVGSKWFSRASVGFLGSWVFLRVEGI
jgi:hypothetical protein